MAPKKTKTDTPKKTGSPKETETPAGGKDAAARKGSSSGQKTKQRILDATIRTLTESGIADTSARAIARTGDFNQALIFYHFDSVDGALVAAVAELTRQRKERHADRLSAANSLVDLVDIALELHHEDVTMNHMTALIQAMAGASGNPEMGPALYAQLDQWSGVVSEAIDGVLGDSPVAGIVANDDVAKMISSLFLGIELLNDLDPKAAGSDKLFESLRSLAAILQMLIDSPLAALVPDLLKAADSQDTAAT